MRSSWKDRNRQVSLASRHGAWRPASWAGIGTLLIATIIGPVRSSADTDDVMSQPPWAYTYHGTSGQRMEFMATTPSREDRNVWLLLACFATRRFYVSFVDAKKFPFPLPERAEIGFRLDALRPLVLPVAAIEQKQITADPDSTKDLFAVLTRSKQLSVSIPERTGLTHNYSFSLQPNDLALRDIDIHCFQSDV